MGYFDALTSSSFKATEDGRRFFFPWGTLGRGYLIPTVEEFDRLRSHVKTYLLISFSLIIITVNWGSFLGAVAVLTILIVPYAIWARGQCHRLKETNEKLTMSESIAGQARFHSTITLWLLEILALTLVAAGVFIVIMDTRNWLVGAGSILLFGLCAFVFAWMITAKRRGPPDNQ
jgi:hypothetical protein